MCCNIHFALLWSMSSSFAALLPAVELRIKLALLLLCCCSVVART